MPVDLPVRKTVTSSIPAVFENAIAVLAVVCLAVAVAGLVSHTPRDVRAGLSVAVYQTMLLSP